MALSPWDFKHLEVVGTKCSSPSDWAEIRGRIPRLKVETRKWNIERKQSQVVQPKIGSSADKRQTLSSVKPPKENIVTIKVVLPKREVEVPERNYLCKCEEEQNGHEKASRDQEGDVEEIGFHELMIIFFKYCKGPKKESPKAFRNIVKGFQGSKILTDDEMVQVCSDFIHIEAVLIRLRSLRRLSDNVSIGLNNCATS